MNIREISKPVTAKSLNESLAKKFGKRIALEQFTLEQLQDVRNKLRTTLSQVETNDILNEINRMNGHIGNMIRPVRDAYFTQKRDDMMKELDRRPRPPPTMY